MDSSLADDCMSKGKISKGFIYETFNRWALSFVEPHGSKKVTLPGLWPVGARLLAQRLQSSIEFFIRFEEITNGLHNCWIQDLADFYR